jgi:hypothetical protein
MAKSKVRDYFRYPQGEEDLVQFVVKSDKLPLKPQLLFTEEELKSTLKTVNFDEIKHRIQTQRVLNFRQEALLLTNQDVHILMGQTCVETLNCVYDLISALIEHNQLKEVGGT